MGAANRGDSRDDPGRPDDAASEVRSRAGHNTTDRRQPSDQPRPVQRTYDARMQPAQAPLSLQDAVLALEVLMISRAQGDAVDPASYVRVRNQVLANPEVARRLPSFVRIAPTIQTFWTYIKTELPTYDARRQFIRKGFEPALAYVSGKEQPAPEASSPETGATPVPVASAEPPFVIPSEPPTRPLRAFLCHSKGDKAAVRELYKRLLADGIRPWLDEEDLLPGQDWQLEIPRAVRNSDVVLVCLSTESVDKTGYVQKEIKFALDAADERPEGTIFIVPARLDDCVVPERLRKWQWVDLFEADGYDRLLRALQVRAADVGADTGE